MHLKLTILSKFQAISDYHGLDKAVLMHHLTQQKCPHANACLTCTHFRTSKKHLKQHKSQLNETNKIIENAKQNGWHRTVEMNTEVVGNLTLIINSLEKADG